MDIRTILESGVAVATLVGGAVTIYTYWKNSGLKRAEWLYQLYEKFYEAEYYKKMRQLIDYEREEQIAKLRNGVENDCEDELIESLVDYLNFFEFIASLWKLGQLSEREICMVFEYYILRVSDYDFINRFMAEEGFEYLPQLIAQLKKTKAQ